MALDRDLIVRTALRLLNEVGLEELSLRRIARELDVQAPALYWHFRNKQALLDEMAAAVLADGWRDLLPLAESRPWQEWLRDYALALRQILLSYRDGARMFSGTYLTDPALFAPMEQSLAIMVGYGFTLPTAVQVLNTIYAYAVGFTIEEQAVFPVPGVRDSRYELTTRAERVDATRFPLVHATGATVLDDYATRYVAGVDLIIAGVAATIAPQSD
jgi:TetR/AcrR family tetracycline transcriptional repressor